MPSKVCNVKKSGGDPKLPSCKDLVWYMILGGIVGFLGFLFICAGIVMPMVTNPDVIAIDPNTLSALDFFPRSGAAMGVGGAGLDFTRCAALALNQPQLYWTMAVVFAIITGIVIAFIAMVVTKAYHAETN